MRKFNEIIFGLFSLTLGLGAGILDYIFLYNPKKETLILINSFSVSIVAAIAPVFVYLLWQIAGVIKEKIEKRRFKRAG